MKLVRGQRCLALLFGLLVAILGLAPIAVDGQDKDAKVTKDSPPNKDLKPTFGKVKLSAGFKDDPFTKELVAGGPIRTKLGDVGAWIAEAPDFILDYTTDPEKPRFPLTIYVESSSDTTLLVGLPNGTWVADDDSGGNLNPLIRLQKPQPGRYLIWVGTFGEDTAIARLSITELTPRRPDPPKKDTWTALTVTQLEQILKEDVKVAPRRVSSNELEWNHGDDVISVTTYSKGKALVISAALKKTSTLEKVNDWNDQRILSRAVLKSSQPRLEADLDCEPGVSVETIRNFIVRFHGNLNSFKEFLAK